MVEVLERARSEVQAYVREAENQIVGLPIRDVAKMITSYMENVHRVRVHKGFGDYVTTLRQKEEMWPKSDIGRQLYFRKVAEGVCNGFALMNIRAKEVVGEFLFEFY